MSENIFGKAHGRYDEIQALSAQRSLIDQMLCAFHAMPQDMRVEAMERFNEVFSHPHINVKFKMEMNE